MNLADNIGRKQPCPAYGLQTDLQSISITRHFFTRRVGLSRLDLIAIEGILRCHDRLLSRA
ncbi:hypothetical protein BA898_06590 [Spiribacter roseus]|nr:hypothetical protein BA898_06590 [Spiribacter roseus]